MKNSVFYIILLIILSSCVSQIIPSQENVIVDILSQENVMMGKGVYLDSHTVLTNTHVISRLMGQKVRLYSGQYSSIDALEVFPGKDISALHVKNEATQGESLSFHKVEKNHLLYALVERSGAIIKIEGKVTDTNVSYLGYDSTLSGKLYTGAIESDIFLSPGDSGTPIWKNTGELVGIVSAVDIVNKRSYIVHK